MSKFKGSASSTQSKNSSTDSSVDKVIVFETLDIKETLIKDYQDSKQCEENDLKQAEFQDTGEAEQKNQEAIFHSDYPEDYS